MIHRNALRPLGIFAALALVGCGWGGNPPSGGETGDVEDSEAWDGNVAEAARFLRPRDGTAEDWRTMREKAAWAWGEGLDTLPIGKSMARLGLSFVGTRYTPGTLELAGNEAVVVNFEEFDCVTFVENVLALARFLRLAKPGILESDVETRALYTRILTQIRYRGGKVDGYASRLHYFTDWILDNERKGLVLEVTAALGGLEDRRPVEFMSAHPDAYRQLSDPATLGAVRERERFLSALPRYRIPEEAVSVLSRGIQDGDIIAATSTVEGLDVAHTGLAVWQGETLHLLHAPLVGASVELSEAPLADRIIRIGGQDGIRVVRPLPPEGSGKESGSSP